MLTRFLATAAALSLIALTPAASAQDVDAALEAEAVRIYKTLPRPSTILQLPSVDVYTQYGTDADKTIKADVPGGLARQFRIVKAGDKAWDAAIQAPNAVPVKAGEVIHASFWARASKLPRGAASARVPVSLQKNGVPYTQIVYEEVELTPEWTLHSLAGETTESYGPGGMVLNLQAATAAQTLELGPVFLNTLGAGPVPDAAQTAAASDTLSATDIGETQASGPVDLASLPAAIRSDARALLQRLPSGAQLMTQPVVRAGASYGGDERLVSDSGVPGGTALEVVTPKAQVESWHVGINLPITMDVARGDVMLLAVWAKTVDAPNESQTAAMQPIRIQQSGEPYTMAGAGAAYLTRDWELYYVPVEASDSFGAGSAGITYHLGLTPQTIRVGPTYLFKFPAGTDVRALPKNEINYAGREADAPWRAEAMAAIDRHRKADLVITAAPGTEVRVQQTNHAFHLGSFTGHRFADRDTADLQNWHREFDATFNTATLPIYWADWGWAGPGTHEDDYKRAIALAGERGLPWRAHTVMWPGANYMPSRMLAPMSAKDRRKLVEDHVREVVTHIRDAELPPFAVDFTNEPRANRYFQENGDPDLVPDMFKLAHRIAPDLALYVNDYGILNNGGYNSAAIDYYHQWIRDMQAKGVPLGGIGFQGHFAAGLTPPEKLIDILEDFSRYDLPLHITEFDIETLDDAAQADYTRDALLAALSVPAVDAFVFWGFWEGDHWKPNAAMVRNDWSVKPAYTALRELVFEDLWTDTLVRVGPDGQATVRGMRGDYTVSVDGRSQAVSLDEGGARVSF